ncbi:hypothetical protein M2448_003867 [Dysgonomonas sp. PF1-14]|uniref:hypothetical protein n=2 Tax=Dysgonomonas TaxID=156973 RepID=UPI0024732C26|nr:hypothetical protein [Dysgonomonas sp. PF1-14]MDH6310915.1 hypothetical protein [Dysgonomonas sp. PF1-14]
MRKIRINYIDRIKEVPLISSKRDGRERIIVIKGLFEGKPEHKTTGTLPVKENVKFENGEFARVKGGLFKVQKIVSVKMKKITIPLWKANLFISLFNGDGGDGFEKDEIEEAILFIEENKLCSLTEISEPADNEITCKFRIR